MIEILYSFLRGITSIHVGLNISEYTDYINKAIYNNLANDYHVVTNKN